MTASQRAALIEMTDAILACRSADASMRFRAQNLRDRLDPFGIRRFFR